MPVVPPVPFLYLRHGETDWNAEGRAQGRSDIPLNATGRAQARDAAALLARAGTRIEAIVASPLARAAETARIVGETIGVEVTFDPAFREVAFGAREGDRMGAWYEAWLAGEETPPGGESFAALTDRAAEGLARHLASGGIRLFVAHGALFRAIRAVLGLPIDQRLANGIPLRCAVHAGIWTIAPVAETHQPE